MSELQELLKRIDRVESKNEIEALITAFAMAFDEHDLPRLGSLFTPDATLSAKNGTMAASGRDGITKMFGEMLAIRGPSYHWTHDRIISVDPVNSDLATGIVLGHAEATPNGKATLVAMRYDDIYSRHESKWSFSKRTVSFFYSAPVNEYPEMLASTLRVRTIGGNRAADYPESLPSWKEFTRTHPPSASQ